MSDRFSARIAEAYGSHSKKYASVLEPMLKPIADEMVDLAKLTSGELVLDLATGTGLVARTVSQFTNSIVGIDISLGMLGEAQTLAAGRIFFVAGNALILPFCNGIFDVVTCGLSLSHFPDISVALGELNRVLRPGGLFITSAWGTKGKSPSKEAANKVRNGFLEARESVFEGSFNDEIWAEVETGLHALRQAGFTNVRVSTRLLSREHRNHGEAIEYALAWPLTRYRIARLAPAEQRRLREEISRAILKVDDLRWQSEVHYYQAIRK